MAKQARRDTSFIVGVIQGEERNTLNVWLVPDKKNAKRCAEEMYGGPIIPLDLLSVRKCFTPAWEEDGTVAMLFDLISSIAERRDDRYLDVAIALEELIAEAFRSGCKAAHMVEMLQISSS